MVSQVVQENVPVEVSRTVEGVCVYASLLLCCVTHFFLRRKRMCPRWFAEKVESREQPSLQLCNHSRVYNDSASAGDEDGGEGVLRRGTKNGEEKCGERCEDA